MAPPISVPADGRAVPRASKRLLALRGDDQLVERVRRGDEAAFEVIYERHVPGVLSFCRHMLGSRDEGEDAVQQTLAAAHRDLLRDDREIRLKPWLYTIARNRCVSMLRVRREQPDDTLDVSTEGLDDQVQCRADLRALVADLQDLPEDQRAALVLCELGGLSHADVAEALGCQVHNVKGLVFRARSALIERREARSTSCEEIQQELATARRGGLRRGKLRHHVRSCPACSNYLEQVRAQRQMMRVILPVAPTVGLKEGVLAALGIGGGASGGGGAAAGGGGLLAALLPAGGATVAKVAVVGALVAGAGVTGETALDGEDRPAGSTPGDAGNGPRSSAGQAHSDRPGERRGSASERRARARAEKRSKESQGALAQKGPKQDAPTGRAQRGPGKSSPALVPDLGAAPGLNGVGVGPRKPLALAPQPPGGVLSPQLPAPRLPSTELPSTERPSSEVLSPQLPSPQVPSPQVPSPPVPSPQVPSPQLPRR